MLTYETKLYAVALSLLIIDDQLAGFIQENSKMKHFHKVLSEINMLYFSKSYLSSRLQYEAKSMVTICLQVYRSYVSFIRLYYYIIGRSEAT